MHRGCCEDVVHVDEGELVEHAPRRLRADVGLKVVGHEDAHRVDTPRGVELHLPEDLVAGEPEPGGHVVRVRARRAPLVPVVEQQGNGVCTGGGGGVCRRCRRCRHPGRRVLPRRARDEERTGSRAADKADVGPDGAWPCPGDVERLRRGGGERFGVFGGRRRGGRGCTSCTTTTTSTTTSR